MGKIVPFKSTKGEMLMCKIAEEIRAKGFDTEAKVIARAEELLDYYDVRPVKEATPIIEIMSKMGIKSFQSEMKPKELSAYITVNPDYIEKFGSSKIACVNEDIPYGHKRFALAHELAHYLFDYQEDKNATYYNTYYPGHDTSNVEQRANLFAANFLAPAAQVKEKYEEYKKETTSALEIAEKMCQFFGVTYTCMKKRFEEVGLGEI